MAKLYSRDEIEQVSCPACGVEPGVACNSREGEDPAYASIPHLQRLAWFQQNREIGSL